MLNQEFTQDIKNHLRNLTPDKLQEVIRSIEKVSIYQYVVYQVGRLTVKFEFFASIISFGTRR